MLCSVLNVGEFSDIERRQTGLPTQHNISQTVTPLLTGRWTAGIDARLQMSLQANAPNPNCTLAICTGVGLCGAAKSIGVNWATYQLKIQLRANDVHTISFVTTCSSPAYVALRNLVIPGSGSTTAPVTSTLIVPTTIPAQISITTVTESVTLVETATSISPPDVSTLTVTQVSITTETGVLLSLTQPVSETREAFNIRYNWGYNGNEDCGDGAIVLASAPNNPDFMILNRNNLDEIPIDSANYSLTLTPLNGRKLCTFHGFDEYEHCDWEGVPQRIEMREQRDGLNLRCPHNDGWPWPVDPPDESYGTSNVFLQIDVSCPNVIKQIGCTRYSSCTFDAYSGTGTLPISFVYPFNQWLRFKAVGTGWTKAFWTVSYGGSVAAQYTQRRGERINIAQNNELNGVGDVQVTVNCQVINEIQASNRCQFYVLLGNSSVKDSQIVRAYGSASVGLEVNEPATITTLNGQYLCAHDERTEVETCGYETINVGPFDFVDSHAVTLTCPSSPQGLDLSGATINVLAQSDFLSNAMDFALQVGCEADQPCNAFTAFNGVDYPSRISATYPITSPSTRLRVKAFSDDSGRQIYSANWAVKFSDDGPEETMFQMNGDWLIIDVPTDATSIILSVTALYAPPQPPPRFISLGVSNFCPTDAVLIGIPTNPDYMILARYSGAGFQDVRSDDPRLIFESPSGRQLCASLDRTGLYTCGVEGIIAAGLIDGDNVHITCPGDRPPQPNAATTIPARIGTTSTSPKYAVQIGCEPGNYCNSAYGDGYGTAAILDYPILSPMARFRVRILALSSDGQSLGYVEWLVGFSGGPQTTYYQARGQWFEVVVPSDATSVYVLGNAVLSGTMPSGPTRMLLALDVDNTCSGAVLVSTPSDPEYEVIFGHLGASFNRGVTANDPRLKFKSLSTRQVCAVLDRTGLRQCGVTNIEIYGLIDNDEVRIECADGGPPAPDPGVPITVRITTSPNVEFLVAQIGCEPGNYCLSHEEAGQGAGNNADIVFDYPTLSPMARLRVRVVKDASGNNYHMAEWRVGFSGGPPQAYDVLRADWFEIAVPSDATSIEIQVYLGPYGDPSS
jgi:hypothetical protein